MTSKNLNFFLLFVTVLISQVCYSQTEFSGGIFANTVWTKANSPYIITGNIALYPGFQLQIESGVQVKFNSNTKFIVRGKLIIDGVQGDSVVFTSNNSSSLKGQWQGIDIENNNGGSIKGTYFVGKYADRFIEIMGSSSGQIINISNARISDNNYAFYGYDGAPGFSVSLANSTLIRNNFGYIYAFNLTIDNCLFSRGDKGVHGWEGRDIVIKNSEFSYFTTYPFNLQGDISNTKIHHNAVGIRMKPQLYVTNCIITDNTIGISADYPIPVQGTNISGNKICDNTNFNFQHLYSYAISIPNNCWCSNNINTISDGIVDAFDDVNLGIVTVEPLMSCAANILPVIVSYLGASTFEEDNTIEFKPTDFNITDPDHVLPENFSITVLTGDNYAVSNSTLTPLSEYSGQLSVSVVISYGSNNSAPFEFTIQIMPANDIPVITAYSGVNEIDEDQPISFQLTDFAIVDPDSNSPNDFLLTVLTGDNYTFSGSTITPALNFVGQLSVSVLVSDGLNNSAPFEFVIQIMPVNDIPVITEYSGVNEMDKNQPISFQLTDFTIVDPDFPNDFLLTVLAGDNYTFSGSTITPTLNFVGQLFVPVVVSDGESNSEPFEVIITCNDIVLSVEETNSLFSVYPNPFLTQLSIKNRSGINIKSIDIKDVLGKNVFSQQYGPRYIAEIILLDLNSLESGLYTMQINSQENKNTFVRIIRK